MTKTIEAMIKNLSPDDTMALAHELYEFSIQQLKTDPPALVLERVAELSLERARAGGGQRRP